MKDTTIKELIFLTIWIVIVVFFLGISIYFTERKKTSNIETDDIVDISGGRYEIINEYTQNDGIEESIHYYIAYDKVTKVIYTIGKAPESSPTFTVMVGPTGDPIRYGGKDHK